MWGAWLVVADHNASDDPAIMPDPSSPPPPGEVTYPGHRSNMTLIAPDTSLTIQSHHVIEVTFARVNQ